MQAITKLFFASDGWKNKNFLRGAPLINMMLLKPSGGSIFVKILDTSRQKKTAQHIADLHIEQALIVSLGRFGRPRAPPAAASTVQHRAGLAGTQAGSWGRATRCGQQAA